MEREGEQEEEKEGAPEAISPDIFAARDEKEQLEHEKLFPSYTTRKGPVAVGAVVIDDDALPSLARTLSGGFAGTSAFSGAVNRIKILVMHA